MNKNGKRIRRSVAVLLCGMALTSGLTVFAQKQSTYIRHEENVGSTAVMAEVGFEGSTAYATVRSVSGAYIDAVMNGTVYYIGGDDVALRGSFSQQSYGQAERTVDGIVCGVSCKFNITSDDGAWNPYFELR